jgi:hypothetical protein
MSAGGPVMGDVLEGLVLDVVDGEMLEVEVEHVLAPDPGRYGAREYVRVTEGGRSTRGEADQEESAAYMGLTYQNRRVRVLVEERDDQGRLIGEVEVLGSGTPDPIFGILSDDD